MFRAISLPKKIGFKTTFLSLLSNLNPNLDLLLFAPAVVVLRPPSEASSIVFFFLLRRFVPSSFRSCQSPGSVPPLSDPSSIRGRFGDLDITVADLVLRRRLGRGFLPGAGYVGCRRRLYLCCSSCCRSDGTKAVERCALGPALSLFSLQVDGASTTFSRI